MIRRSAFAASLFALAFVVVPDAGAQPLSGPTCTIGTNCVHTLNASVPTLVNLTLENAATNLGAITAANFDDGQLIDGPRFEARANRTYAVTLASASALFTGSGNAAKAAGDVRYAVVTSAAGCGTAGTFAAVTTSAVSIFSGLAGLSPRQQLCFNIVWRYASDAPGTYALPLNLSVTAP